MAGVGFLLRSGRRWTSLGLIGSQAGLLRFKKALLRYANDPGNAAISEHEHFGPYMYLEVMTWPEPGFDDLRLVAH